MTSGADVVADTRARKVDASGGQGSRDDDKTAPGFFRTAVDLRNNRYLAHLHRDGLVVPFSDPGVVKYLPAAKSGLAPHSGEAGRTLRLQGRNGTLALPLSANLCRTGCWFHLALEQKLEKQFLGIYVNGKAISTQPLSAGMSTVRAQIPPGVVKDGENSFRFYFSRKGTVAGKEMPVDLFWLAVTSEKALDLRKGASFKRIVGKKKTGLNFLDYSSWSWNLAVPPASQVEVGWSGEGGCPVSVSVERMGVGETVLAVSHSEPGLTRFQLNEANGGSGEVVALRITRTRSAVLTDARVVVPLQPMKELGPEKPRNIIVWLTAGMPAHPEQGGESDGVTSMQSLIKRGVYFRNVEAQSPVPWKSFTGVLAGMQPHWARAALEEDIRSMEPRLLPAILKKKQWRAALFSGEAKLLKSGKFRRVFHEIIDFNPSVEEEGDRASLASLEPWLEEHKKDPFFAVVAPWSRQAYFRQRKGYTDPKILAGYRGSLPSRLGEVTFSRIRSGKEKLRARDRAYIAALAEGEAAFQDSLLGDLVSKLQELQIEDDTLLVVVGASGAELFQHGGVGLGHSLHAESVGVSMLLVHPKSLPAGMEVGVCVELEDLAPTLLHSAGLAAPQTMQGANLFSLIRNPSMAIPRSSFSRRTIHERSVRLGHYRMLRSQNFEDRVFDLREDPLEQNPLTDLLSPVAQALRDTMAFHTRYAKRWRKARHGLPSNQSETFAQDARSWWGR